MQAPLVISYGGGTNSTAMLVGMVDRGVRPDLILFADTGGEMPETYEFVETFSEWLTEHGQEPLITVKAARKDETLEQECLRKGTLPSLAFGWKKCSLGWKVTPQDKYVNSWNPAMDWWAQGGKVLKAIGYDAGEFHRKKPESDKKYDYWYPLLEWGWAREECIEAIKEAGLEPPNKSACFFCPAAKKHEVRRLANERPELFERAVAMERNAKDSLVTIDGLGRNWSWEAVAKADAEQLKMFPDTVDMPCMCFDGAD